MMHSRDLAVRLAVMLLVCSACQAIAGIRERTSAVSEECVEFCDNADRECAERFHAYRVTEACEALCGKLDPPESPEQAPTLECLKNRTGQFIELDECKHATPSSGTGCGDPCDNYCALYPRVCDNLFPAGSNRSECRDFCNLLVRDDEVDAKETFDVGGSDTLQCRFAHLSVAAAADVAGDEMGLQHHCKHARGDLSGAVCLDKEPNCQQYCRIVMTACTGDREQYASEEHCKAVCEKVPKPTEPGVKAEKMPINCRLQAAYKALQTPGDDFCKWAGPSGGECDNECTGYCQLLAAACPNSDGTDNAVATCTMDCERKSLHLDRNFKCRLDSIADALHSPSDMSSACQKAIGQGACAL